MNDPTVSVLMAVRNGATHLPETVESLSKQSLAEVEFVTIDDCSEDETPQTLAGWAARDPRVRVLTGDAPMGLPRALNWGLEQCRAPLVARADGDDLYHPERLARQLQAFRANPKLGALSTGYTRIDEGGAEINRVEPERGHEWIRFRMLFMNSLLHPGVMFRADVVRSVGGYDETYWTAQDSDLWARLVDVTRIDNLPDNLVRYRIHQSSVMRKRGTAGRDLSLTVPARLQKAYLGKVDYDVPATVDLFQGFRPMQPDEIRRGLMGLSRIHAAARKREPVTVLSQFRGAVARSLYRQARRLGRRHPRNAAELLLRTVAWRWSARLANLRSSSDGP